MIKFDKIITKVTNDNHKRNRLIRLKKVDKYHPVIKLLKIKKIRTKKLLEIGCSTGFVLKRIKEITNADCYGIDASQNAISEGKKIFNGIKLYSGTLEKSNLKKKKFDLIIFGFFLFLLPPEKILNLFSIVDNMLNNGGKIIIYDFYAKNFNKIKYKHKKGLFSYKWNFKNVFLSLPQYKLVYLKVEKYKKTNDKIEVSLLKKEIK